MTSMSFCRVFLSSSRGHGEMGNIPFGLIIAFTGYCYFYYNSFGRMTFYSLHFDGGGILLDLKCLKIARFSNMQGYSECVHVQLVIHISFF